MFDLHRNLFRIARQDPGFRQVLIRHLRAGVERVIAVKELPDVLQRKLKGLGYAKRDIRVAQADDFSPNSASGGSGRRGMVSLINLSSGISKDYTGSWGGSNIFTQTVVDDDNRHIPIPQNHAVIMGEGGTRLDYARILIHPSNFAALMVEGPQEALTEKEQQALNAIVGLKPGARANEFQRFGLGEYNITNPLIQALIQKKLLEIKGGKTFVTIEGKNRRTRSW